MIGKKEMNYEIQCSIDNENWFVVEKQINGKIIIYFDKTFFKFTRKIVD